MITIINGDLLQLARDGKFDIIIHGCNCQNVMGAGIAAQIKKQFPDAFAMDTAYFTENHGKSINMMGNYSEFFEWINDDSPTFYILNCYTQFMPGVNSPGCEIPLDYNALTCIMRKINYRFKGKRIGMPWIGCGLAGGDSSIVAEIMENTLTDMTVTIVNYADNKNTVGQMASTGLGDATSGREVYNNVSAQGNGGRDLATGLRGREPYDQPLSEDFGGDLD